MGKVSFASKDAYEVKGGFQEGWFEVVDAKTAVWNFPQGAIGGPFLAMLLSINKLDDRGNSVSEEPLELMLKIESDLNKMRPGHADSPDDDDPKDLGDELGTEGNAIFSADGARINSKTKFMAFCRSLEEQGFKPDILSRAYAPDFIGLKAHAKTVAGDKIKDRTTGQLQDTTHLIVDKITQFPYEKKAVAAKSTPATAKRTAAVGGTSTTTVSSNGTSSEAEEIAMRVLAEVSGELSGSSKKLPAFKTLAYTRHVRMKDVTRNPSLDKEVQNLIRSNDWLVQHGSDLGYAVEGDEVKFS